MKTAKQIIKALDPSKAKCGSCGKYKNKEELRQVAYTTTTKSMVLLRKTVWECRKCCGSLIHNIDFDSKTLTTIDTFHEKI